MNIVCNKKLDVDEGLTVEFKASLIFAPKAGASMLQQEAIAKTVSAFINTNGGTLYLGVNDSGIPVGIQNDILSLASRPSMFETHGKFSGDAGYSYRQTVDQYFLKFQKIVEAHLGKNMLRYIGDYKTGGDQGCVYLMIPIRAADKGDITYFYGRNGMPEIWIRTPGANRILTNLDRDDYVRRRTSELAAPNVDANEMLKKIYATLVAAQGEKEGQKRAIEDVLAELHTLMFPNNGLRNCKELCKTYDPEASSLAIMDEFEKVDENGEKIYGRLALMREPCMVALPYVRSGTSQTYIIRKEFNFALYDICILVERCDAQLEEASMRIADKNCLSFSDLRKNAYSMLTDEIWRSLPADVIDAPFHAWHTVLFNRLIGFKANNSKSLVMPVYRIVGVKLSKCPLGKVPDEFSSTWAIPMFIRDWRRTASLEHSRGWWNQSFVSFPERFRNFVMDRLTDLKI